MLGEGVMGNRSMASCALRLTALMGLLLWGGLAQAAPDNGFGLYVGAIHSNDSALYGTSRGGDVRADMQLMVNDQWSLSPYLDMSFENTDSIYSVTNGIAGLQARRWFDGGVFIGGQYFFHDLLLRNGGTVQSSSYGPAFGLAAGWEGDSHWSVLVEWNTLEGQGFSWSSTNDRSDVRVLVGYHWY